MWPTMQESGPNIHNFDPLTSEAAVDCKLGCSPLPSMTGVSHEGRVTVWQDCAFESATVSLTLVLGRASQRGT